MRQGQSEGQVQFGIRNEPAILRKQNRRSKADSRDGIGSTGCRCRQESALRGVTVGASIGDVGRSGRIFGGEGIDGDTVGCAQSEILALALEFKIGMEAVGDAGSVFARSEHHQETPGRKCDVGEGPGPWVRGVIGQVPSRQLDVLIGDVLEFNPVFVIALLVSKGLLVVRDHLRQNDSSGSRRREQLILDGLGSGETVGDVRQIADIGVTGPGERRGAEGELWEREHVNIGAHRSHGGRRKAVDSKVSSIDSLNRFAEMHLDLGKAEDEAGFWKDRLERRWNYFGVGQTSSCQQAEQGKTQ